MQQIDEWNKKKRKKENRGTRGWTTLHKIDWWHQTRNLTPPINYPICRFFISPLSIRRPLLVRARFPFSLFSLLSSFHALFAKISGKRPAIGSLNVFFETRCRAGDKRGLSRVNISRAGGSCIAVEARCYLTRIRIQLSSLCRSHILI